MAKSSAARSPVVAEVFRRCASDALALELVGERPSWDAPHRVLAGVRLLALRGEVADFEAAREPWDVFRAVLGEQEEWLAAFVRERTVQTNEVQRCWALLPIFLTVARMARRPLALVELGTSAGLNLLWDRYSYSYRAGTWGDGSAPVRLDGEERSPVPAGLLRTDVEVATRIGIDLEPVDATTEDGMRLLKAFVRDDGYWARLERAASVLSEEPPTFMRGDYLELLPGLLEKREEGTLTVVFQTHSTVYLTDDERRRLRSTIESAGARAPLAWIATPTPEEHRDRRGDYPLELAVWPDGSRRIVARTNVRGEWLEWTG